MVISSKNPGIQAIAIYGFVLVVFAAYYWLRDSFQWSPAELLIINHTPETLIIVALIILRKYRRPWFPVGEFSKTLKQHPFIWFGLAIVAVYFGYLQGSFDPMPLSRFIKIHFSGNILGSSAEEVAIRGGVLTALSQTRLGKQMLGKLSFGNLIQAIAFASLHIFLFIKMNLPLQEAAVWFIVLTIGGLVFGYVYQRTSNLWNCIFLHVLLNLGVGP